MPQAGDVEQLRQLVVANSQSREAIARAAAAQIRAQVRAFQDWYTTAAVAALSIRLASQAESSQRLTASLTDAYLSRVLTVLRGKPVSPAGTVKVDGLRAGVTHPGVYGRLADQYRWEISKHTDPAQVLRHVEDRAELLVTTDNDLAFRSQAQASMSAARVDGYRRVLHPELSKGGVCGLCIVASDRIYTVDRLMPLHDRCNCGVLPILDGFDPGQDLNAADLRAVYKAAGSTGRADLKKVRVKVHDHGELGPVLRDARYAFRGPDDVTSSH